jgi:hypothetical protein
MDSRSVTKSSYRSSRTFRTSRCIHRTSILDSIRERREPERRKIRTRAKGEQLGAPATRLAAPPDNSADTDGWRSKAIVSRIARPCRDASGVGQSNPIDDTVPTDSTWAFNTTGNTSARRLPRARRLAVSPLQVVYGTISVTGSRRPAIPRRTYLNRRAAPPCELAAR